MSNDSGDGHSGHSHRGRKSSPMRRLRRWWYGSALYKGYCRGADRLYDWWHPRSEEGSGYAGYYGRSRRGRLARAWGHARRWLGNSAPFRAWRAGFIRFSNWWYTESKRDPSKPGYGYGHSRRSRLTRGIRSFTRWLRQSAFSRLMTSASNAFYNWWYPLVDDSHSHSAYGYYGRRRRSRPALVAGHVRRRWRTSWLGRMWQRVNLALWEWWYPEVEDSHSGYGYGHYGPRRRSRLQLAIGRVRRWWRNSWLGKTWRRFNIAFWEWWYPEPDGVSGGYGYGSRRRVSRPVRFAKRVLRWCRRTWLGRKLKWLLDDLENLAYYVSWRIRQDFALWRIRQWMVRWQTWALLLCLAAGTVYGYRYGLPRYHAFQEHQYAQQADLWLKKGDLARAVLRARQTLSLNQSNAIATRVIGNVAEFCNSPQALYWRRRAVMLAPDATNRLELASTALKFENFPFPIANQALSEITPEVRVTPSFHLIAGAMALKFNNLAEAERHYTEALKLDPNNPATRLSLAVVRLHAQDPKIINDSRTTLELLRTDRSVGLLALRSLVAESVDHHELDRAETLSSQVLTNAQASFSDRILHLAILKASKSDKLADFLKETQAKASQNVMAIGELAAWMNSSGHAGEALDWLNSLPAEQTRQGFLPISVADAYVALGAWKDLETYLMSGSWPGLDHIRYAMLAMASWRQTGERPSTTWRLAVRAALRSPVALSSLADLAAAWGWRREAEETIWEAVDGFPDQSWPLDNLDRFYTSRGDTEGLRRVYATRMQRNPEDQLARNNFAMVSLLLNKDVTRAQEMATELHAAEPQSPIFSSTYAFALHLQGRTQEGIAVLRALPLEQLNDPALGLYYGVLLAADGQKEIAQDYLKRAASTFMLPQEKALLDQAVGR